MVFRSEQQRAMAGDWTTVKARCSCGTENTIGVRSRGVFWTAIGTVIETVIEIVFENAVVGIMAVFESISETVARCDVIKGIQVADGVTSRFSYLFAV